MAEDTGTTATEQAPPPATEEQPPATSDGDLGDAGRKALEQERTARKDAEKARKALERELEQVRQSSMSEAEKAVAEAEARGRTAATQDFGKRLARSDFTAAAARRNPDFDVSQALEWVDLARFVGDDGEPDAKAITSAVERLVPAASSQPPSFDGGARTPAPVGADMNTFIRKATGRA